MFISLRQQIVTTSDVRFYGDVSVPPEMVTPIRGRTDKPSALRHVNALEDVTGRDPLDRVRDGYNDMPAMDVNDFLYLVGTRHVDDEDGSTYQTTRVLIEMIG